MEIRLLVTRFIHVNYSLSPNIHIFIQVKSLLANNGVIMNFSILIRVCYLSHIGS
jgi:hypothetical protein